MPVVSFFRLNLLRAMYLFITTGLLLTVWPNILAPATPGAGPVSVVRALLGALSILCLLGLRYPLKMLPLLLFEWLWKLLWLCASALPMALGPGLDQHASETLFACMVGIVLLPFVLPWSYLWTHYVRAAGEPWRRPRS